MASRSRKAAPDFYGEKKREAAAKRGQEASAGGEKSGGGGDSGAQIAQIATTAMKFFGG
jgi:hypothetical protein